MLRDLMGDKDKAATAAIAELAAMGADIVVLTHVDYDAGHAALTALRDRLRSEGVDYPHLFALRPNSGTPTGRDMDGDGRLGGPRDAQGYGRFAGQGGLAVLSRLPFGPAVDMSPMLWRDLPGSRIAADDPGHDIQRLSSTGHWRLPVQTPSGTLTLIVLAATPPVFDGPEDRNGRRNADEIALAGLMLDGVLPGGLERPDWPVIVGNLNLDPDRGDGLRSAVQALLTHSRLQDPLPGLATVRWDSAGSMRVSYVLPGSAFTVTGAAVRNAVDGNGPHRPVWVDLRIP
ncbi:endonuclease/exonuclease/phosphatase family protein [Thalassococcus arenae]|uniref:endonuclease/exonuclease/phosphatase family protein n=1 Tax=Thalassococcus arenae TaxID=2851652 RepID=UPI0020CAF563|nr:endonuclease/exonuclease/phosphatase family protein [Thalassococcus arenae]